MYESVFMCMYVCHCAHVFKHCLCAMYVCMHVCECVDAYLCVCVCFDAFLLAMHGR